MKTLLQLFPILPPPMPPSLGIESPPPLPPPEYSMHQASSSLLADSNSRQKDDIVRILTAWSKTHPQHTSSNILFPDGIVAKQPGLVSRFIPKGP